MPQYINIAGGTSETPSAYLIGDTADYLYTVSPSLNAGSMYIGSSSNHYHQLTIQNGGDLDVNSGNLILGEQSQYNNVIVTGSGSSMTNAVDLNIGFVGGDYNSLSILNGATVSATNAKIGVTTGEIGNSLTVSGTGSNLTTSNLVRVGDSGDSSSLTVSAGGSVSAYQLWVANGIGNGNASVTVTGANSAIHLTNGLNTSSNSGTANAISVTDGATLDTGMGMVLYSADNSVLIDGMGSTATTATLRLGHSTTTGNDLLISNGGLFINGSGSLTIESGNYLQLDGGYLAWLGDHEADFASYISSSSIQISDGASGWMTATGDDLHYEYFNGDNAAAETFSGYSGLGGYTIIGLVTAVPEPSTYAAIFGLLALGFAIYRRKTGQAARS